MEATPLRAPFTKLLSDFLDPIAPDPVAFGVIRAASDEGVRAQELAPLINSDPGYRAYLFAQTFLSERMTRWEAESGALPNKNELMLERILGLLGKAPVRNLVACAHVERILGSMDPLGADQKIVVTPAKLIPFALEAERICQDNGWMSHEAAFCAGLHFDWLAAAIKKRNGTADEKSAPAAAFKEGLATAKTAYELGQRLRQFELGKHLFAAGLLLPVGKPVMACLFPKSAGDRSWSSFVHQCERAGDHVFDYYQFVEARRFPATHAELGSLLVNFGAILRKLEKSIQFHIDPERLRRADPELYQLASLLSVSVRMTRSGDKKPVLDPFQERWLQANRIDSGALSAKKAGG